MSQNGASVNFFLSWGIRFLRDRSIGEISLSMSRTLKLVLSSYYQSIKLVCCEYGHCNKVLHISKSSTFVWIFLAINLNCHYFEVSQTSKRICLAAFLRNWWCLLKYLFKMWFHFGQLLSNNKHRILDDVVSYFCLLQISSQETPKWG